MLPLFQSSPESQGDLGDLPAQLQACCINMQSKLDGIKTLILNHCNQKSEEEEKKEESVKEVLKQSFYKYIKDWLDTEGAGDKIEEIFQYFIEHAPEYALDLGDFVLDLARVLYYTAKFVTIEHKLNRILKLLDELLHKPNDMAKCCEEVKEALEQLSQNDEDILHSLSVLHKNTEDCCDYLKNYLIQFQHNVLQGQVDMEDRILSAIRDINSDIDVFVTTFEPIINDIKRNVLIIKDVVDAVKSDTSDLKDAVGGVKDAVDDVKNKADGIADALSGMSAGMSECCTKIQNELAAIRGGL